MAVKSNKQLKRRAMIALILTCVVGFGAGAFGVANAALINGEEYKQKAESQQLSDTTVSAQRGTIYDRNMNVLAQSADVWKVYINPSKIKEEETRVQIAEGLSEILELDYETVYAKCQKSEYGYVLIKSQVEYNTKTKIVEFIEANKGFNQIIGTENDVKRYYPYSNFASTVLGFTGADGLGLSGLEYYYDDVLTGTPGRIVTAKNARQYEMSAQYESYYEALQGDNLVLTIDQVIQYYLDSALEQAVIDHQATYGYGIVMDTDTGAILAMSTKLDFDANNPYEVTSQTVLDEIDKIEDEDEKSQALVNARYAQWRNRTVSDSYEPGSVFKCITAAAALEEGVVSADEMFNCTGSYQVKDRTYHCSHREGHGVEDFTTSMMNSCNPIFIEIAQRLGADTFYQYFEAFGFSETTGIDLPAEYKPTANVTYYTGDKLGAVELASTSFGQSFQVSPIQIITGVNAIANGGKLMEPYVVAATLDENGNTTSETDPTIRRQVVSEKTAETVTMMLERTVSGGTAKNAYVAGYRVAGKTGTSEKLPDKVYYIGSFCGYAPADDPEITVLIIIDEPKAGQYYGGSTAAPVAAEVIEQTLKYLNIEPQYTEEELAELDVKAPNEIGKDVDIAKSDLSSQGFTVKVVGSGDKVISQTPSADQVIPKNGLVVLYTEEDMETTKVKVPNLIGLSVADANRTAINSGVNIKISGYTSGASIASYRQSVTEGTEVAMGTIITVSFKSSTNVAD